MKTLKKLMLKKNKVVHKIFARMFKCLSNNNQLEGSVFIICSNTIFILYVFGVERNIKNMKNNSDIAQYHEIRFHVFQFFKLQLLTTIRYFV